MPKQKTNKSAKKRFKLTGTGKLTYKKSGTKHLNGHMSAKRKLRLRRPEGSVDDSVLARNLKMFPYRKYAR